MLLIAKKMAKRGWAISRFLGRATRTSIPNSWTRQIDWRKLIELRSEEIEKRVQRKQRTVGRKLTFEKGEEVLVQNMKNGKWDTKGVITEVRVADDGTVSSYDLMIGDLPTTLHRRYLAKLKNAREADSGEEDKDRAPA